MLCLHFLKKIENSLSRNVLLPLIFLHIPVFFKKKKKLLISSSQTEGAISSRIFWSSLLFNLNNSSIVTTGSEFSQAVFILTGLTSVSDVESWL